jgi:aldose 1-epimerase
MEEAALHSVAESNSFGRTQGRTARLFTLESDLLRVCITDYGGILVSLEAFDRSGTRDHLVLGFDDVSGYVDNRGSFGALLGRNANRIAEGRINIDGHVYELSKNENGATLHGGADGFGKRFWSVTEFDARRLTLRLVSGDGDQELPRKRPGASMGPICC